MKYIYFLLLATMALVQAGLASAQTVTGAGSSAAVLPMNSPPVACSAPD